MMRQQHYKSILHFALRNRRIKFTNTNLVKLVWAQYCVDFPSLFPLTLNKEASISDLWSTENAYWNLYLGRGLKEDEIKEWACLSNLLSSVILTNQEDTWVCNIDKDGIFTSKSLRRALAIATNK
uniref:Uncharacterized protein n=1 Tax=Cucumis melo TaxID=3656 RepID=A0A9I9E8L9_CUCME